MKTFKLKFSEIPEYKKWYLNFKKKGVKSDKARSGTLAIISISRCMSIVQKAMIAAQPKRVNFEKGGIITGPRLTGERGEHIITTPVDHRIYKKLKNLFQKDNKNVEVIIS